MIGIRRRTGVEIRTFCSAGRYQHRLRNIGGGEVSDEVVELLKQVNEKAYDEMLNSSKGLISRVSYEIPK